MKVQVIIPTAGLGIRFGAGDPKTLISLIEKPIFIWTLLAFEESKLIDSIVLVVHEDYLGEYQKLIKEKQFNKPVHVVNGGETRYASVKNGLEAIDKDTDIVVIHDGARPLISTKLIDQAIELCKKEKAVIVGVPLKPTVKKVNIHHEVEETCDRSQLWEIQTPQVFDCQLLKRAYAQKVNEVPTDDAYLIEMLGEKVKVLEGDYKNIKITTKEDLIIAESFLS